MAWTSPRTWVANEIVSAALMNTHVRDNLLETAPAKVTAVGQGLWATGANAIAAVPVRVYKSADESVNNSTTLQNDDHLVWSIAANEIWAFAGRFYGTIASGDPGYKHAFTVPAGASGFFYRFDALVENSLSASNFSDALWSSTITTTCTMGISGVTKFYFELRGVVVNGATAGSVQFQWAQNSAVASNLTLKAGSHFELTRLA